MSYISALRALFKEAERTPMVAQAVVVSLRRTRMLVWPMGLAGVAGLPT